MKLRALVVEDEWATRNYLVELIHKSKAAEVIGAVSNSDAARQILERPPGEVPVDVAFVDIQLVGSKRDDEGLELIRAHAKQTTAPMFVLATAFREHALEAFDLGVVDYLLKPFSEERFDAALERARQRIGKKMPDPVELTASARPPSQYLERIVIKDGTRLPVSRSGYARLLEAMGDSQGNRSSTR